MKVLPHPMKNILFINIIFFLVSCSNKPRVVNSPKMKIGFGSCLKQDKSMPIFDPIKKEGLDLFLMIGDNVYGDSEEEDLKELKSAYKSQKKNFQKLDLDFPFEAISVSYTHLRAHET